MRIIPCNEWGARPPRQPIQIAGRYDKALFHHTAGHHPNLDRDPGESYAEAQAYAKAVQNYHMDGNGWNDSGHNFLVTRSGHIFEGRHRSIELLLRGRCPVSAHCPGQNGHPGVEIEHMDPEPMTDAQRAAAVWLFALICRKGGFGADHIHPHREYFATACPGALTSALPAFRRDVDHALAPPPPPGGPVPSELRWLLPWVRWNLAGRPDPRPAAPQRIPKGALDLLQAITEGTLQ